MLSVGALNVVDFWPISPFPKKEKREGQIALPFILLVSGIIVEIAIAGSFVAYFLSTSGLGVRLALRAEADAKAGIGDAMVHLTQNKEYAASGASYNLNIDSDSVAVSVSRTVNSAVNLYVYTISSVATAGTREKKFVATVTVDQTTGQVQLQSIVEVTVT